MFRTTRVAWCLVCLMLSFVFGCSSEHKSIFSPETTDGAGKRAGGPECHARVHLGEGGTLAGQPIEPAFSRIKVAPGSAISGTVRVRVQNSYPEVENVPLVSLPTWGSHVGGFHTVVEDAPRGATTYDVAVEMRAPATPGIYFLLFASHAQASGAHVASATASASGPAVWDDGNDIADLTAEQLYASANSGSAPVRLYRAPGRYDTVEFGVAYITVVVEGEMLGWSPFSPGWEPNDVVMSSCTWNGNLVIGGVFTMLGSLPANGVALWDGSAWHSLGSGIPGRVYGLGVYQGRLIAVGDFAQAGGGAASCIAAWDGASWSALGSGLTGQGFGQGPWGHKMVEWSGKLYVGGAFRWAGGVQADNIACWDGTGWSALGSGVDGWGEPHVIDVAVYNNKVVAGGWFTQIGGIAASKVAAWDGSSWSPLGTGIGGGVVIALEVHDGLLYAAGDFSSPGANMAVWDGASWQPLSSGTDQNIWALGSFNGRLIVGGTFTTAGGSPASHIAAWDGTQWAPLGEGVDNWVGTLINYGGSLIAGGDFTAAGGQPALHLARWTE